MKPLRDCRLYTFIDTAYLHGRDPGDLTQQLCDGGSDLIQVRAKDWPPEETRRLAEQVLEVTRRNEVGVVINDHPDLAADLQADILHLGQEDFFDAGHQEVAVLKRSLKTSDYCAFAMKNYRRLSVP